MAQWSLAAKARNDFVDMIEGLTPEQMQEQSLCAEWDAKGVLAHLTGFVETSLPAFFATIAKARFDFGKASVAMVNKRIDRSVSDLSASLRAKASKSAALPMFPEAMTVADIAIHTQDVRRPLGLDGSLDDDVLREALDFVTTHKQATNLVDRRSIEGVQLKATDIDWSFGEGAAISGPAEAILMGLANRPLDDALSGDGLSKWS